MSLRNENKLTREEMSEEVGISPKFLYEVEYGKKKFSAHLVLKFSNVFSVSCDELLKLEISEVDKLTGIDGYHVDVEDSLKNIMKWPINLY